MIPKTFKTRFVAAMACGMILTVPFVAHAEDEDLQPQLDNYQQQVQQQNSAKADAEQRIGTFSEQLQQIEIELKQATEELANIQGQRSAVEANIAETQKKLEAAQKRLEGREKIFEKRVRDIYINGRLSYLEVVLGSKDFNDFANRVEVLKRIIDADISLINGIKEERAEIAAAKAQLEADRAKLVELEKQAQAKQAEVEAKKQERQQLLEKARTDQATAIQAIEELEAASQNVKAMIQQRQAERAAQAAAAAAAAAAAQQAGGGDASGGGYADYVVGSGALSWPTGGREITSDYGGRYHPIWGRYIFHDGIDIAADYGEPVHAADGGVVVYAGWISGYGNAVIIDHGNGISTLYGHNESLTVSEGEGVSKGSVIAYAGSTGNSTGPHVHFEVRENGDPVNPLGYL